MFTQIPLWVHTLFLFSTLVCIWSFYISNGKPYRLLVAILFYGFFQAALAWTGFYLVLDSTPPRALFVFVPLILMIGAGFIPRSRAWFSRVRDLKKSTFLHTVRVPVEITLHQLYLAGLVPALMTFEGRNFDILVGLSAPLVGLLHITGFLKERFLLYWNITGLFFVLFIVVNALLSLPTFLQQFAFDQPNLAVFYFPYVLLPAIIVPIVIYTHVSDIIILIRKVKKA